MSFSTFQSFRGFGGGAVQSINLIVNGTFYSDISGWSPQGTVTLAWVSSTISVAAGMYSGAFQPIPTIPGASYRVAAQSVSGTSAHRLRVGDGATPNAGIADSADAFSPSLFSLDFTALSSLSYVYLRGTAVGDVRWDNVSAIRL